MISTFHEGILILQLNFSFLEYGKYSMFAYEGADFLINIQGLCIHY